MLLPFKRKVDDETQLLYFIQNLSDENYIYEIDNDYFLNKVVVICRLSLKISNREAYDYITAGCMWPAACWHRILKLHMTVFRARPQKR